MHECRRRQSSWSPSCIPIILAALLAAAVQPAGITDCGYEERGENARGIYAISTLASGRVGFGVRSCHPCNISTDFFTARNEMCDPEDDGVVQGINLCMIDCFALSDTEKGPQTADRDESSMWSADVIALMVRAGLIFLEFGTRPLKNAKRIFSCLIICFALYRYQFPSKSGVHHKSPKKILVQKILERRALRSSPSPKRDMVGYELGENLMCPTPSGIAALEFHWNETLVRVGGGDGLSSPALDVSKEGVGPSSVRESSTWHFASFYLVIKLVSKMLVLMNLKKTSKKLKVVKLFKLAKLAKLAKFSLGPKSFKMIIRLLGMLKLFKLLKMSKKSKKLYSKKHFKQCKPIFKACKVMRLVVAFWLL